jgi:hypothetical protein
MMGDHHFTAQTTLLCGCVMGYGTWDWHSTWDGPEIHYCPKHEQDDQKLREIKRMYEQAKWQIRKEDAMLKADRLKE